MNRYNLKSARRRIVGTIGTIGTIDVAANGRQATPDARKPIGGGRDPRTDLARDAQARTAGSGNLTARVVR